MHSLSNRRPAVVKAVLTNRAKAHPLRCKGCNKKRRTDSVASSKAAAFSNPAAAGLAGAGLAAGGIGLAAAAEAIASEEDAGKIPYATGAARATKRRILPPPV